MDKENLKEVDCTHLFKRKINFVQYPLKDIIEIADIVNNVIEIFHQHQEDTLVVFTLKDPEKDYTEEEIQGRVSALLSILNEVCALLPAEYKCCVFGTTGLFESACTFMEKRLNG